MCWSPCRLGRRHMILCTSSPTNTYKRSHWSPEKLFPRSHHIPDLIAREINIDFNCPSLCLAIVSLTSIKFKCSLVIMIRRFLHIASCALLLTCSHSGPTNIYDTEALRPSRHEEEFIDGEIQCTGHMLEDNFEDNLASAAASKYDKPSFTNPQSFYGMAVLP